MLDVYVFFLDCWEVRISNLLYRQCSVGQQVMEAPRWDCCRICRSLVAVESGQSGCSSNPLILLLCTRLCWGTASCHQGFQEEGTVSLKVQEDRSQAYADSMCRNLQVNLNSKLFLWKMTEREMFSKLPDFFFFHWTDLLMHLPFGWLHVPSGRQLMNWKPSRSNPV